VKVLTEVSRRSNCRNRLKGQCCSLPKKRTREVVLRSRLFKGQTRAGRGSVLWKGLQRRSSKGQTEAGRGVLGRKGRMRAENTWRRLSRAGWRRREMMASLSKENAAASLGKVDPSPLLQHFSTFSLRMYCSVVYWQSCGGGAGIQKQATFSTSADPSQGGTFEKNFARWLAFTVRTFVAKRRRAVKSLVCSRRGTKYHSGDFCGKCRRGELSPH